MTYMTFIHVNMNIHTYMNMACMYTHTYMTYMYVMYVHMSSTCLVRVAVP